MKRVRHGIKDRFTHSFTERELGVILQLALANEHDRRVLADTARENGLSVGAVIGIADRLRRFCYQQIQTTTEPEKDKDIVDKYLDNMLSR